MTIDISKHKIKITIQDLDNPEDYHEKIVERGYIKDLGYFLDGILLYGDYQHILNNNKSWTDSDMETESEGYLIRVEFKHDIQGFNLGQLLYSQNLSRATDSDQFIFINVVGDKDNPTHYFVQGSGYTEEQNVYPTLFPLYGKEHLKDVLRKYVEATEQCPLISPAERKERFHLASETFDYIKSQYLGVETKKIN